MLDNELHFSNAYCEIVAKLLENLTLSSAIHPLNA